MPAGEHAPPIYDPQADPDGPDGGFELAEAASLHDALALITRAGGKPVRNSAAARSS